MRLYEILERNRFEHGSFWYNPFNDQIINTPRIDHTEYLRKNPEEFGIPSQAIPVDIEPGFDAKLIELAGEYGWVRCGKEWHRPRSYFFQTNNEDALFKAIEIIFDEGILENAYVDTLLDTFVSSTYVVLKGFEEIEYFIKYRKFPPRHSRLR